MQSFRRFPAWCLKFRSLKHGKNNQSTLLAATGYKPLSDFLHPHGYWAIKSLEYIHTIILECTCHQTWINVNSAQYNYTSYIDLILLLSLHLFYGHVMYNPCLSRKFHFPPLSSLTLLKPIPTMKRTVNILHHINNVSLLF